jgi:UDP-glucose 4-epimerase
MNVLIIGSKGFVGSHCHRYFSGLGYNVFGCDIQFSDESNYFQFHGIEKDYGFIFKENKFDVCINAAGAANVSDSFANPEKDFALNVSLVFSLLNAIKNYNPDCKLVNLSSAAVYGNPAELPIKETVHLRPLSPYGYHKMLSEKLLLEYHQLFGLKTCSLRVFSAYGPGLRKQLFWDLYLKMKLSSNLVLSGTGMESRDFIYIDDLVSAIHRIVNSAFFCGESINVSSGVETNISDAVRIFAHYLRNEAPIKFDGLNRLGDPKNWKADVNVLANMGFHPNYTIKDGIRNTVDWLVNTT